MNRTILANKVVGHIKNVIDIPQPVIIVVVIMSEWGYMEDEVVI